jgi:hypothetical protein
VIPSRIGYQQYDLQPDALSKMKRLIARSFFTVLVTRVSPFNVALTARTPLLPVQVVHVDPADWGKIIRDEEASLPGYVDILLEEEAAGAGEKVRCLLDSHMRD